MTKLACIAVDDEPLALEKMVDYISQVPFLTLSGTFENGMEALAFLNSHPVDLAYLDIEMPRLTGIQLLNTLNHRPQVIITSAHSEFAIDGFALEVVDYLLKPIAFEKFLKATSKVVSKTPMAAPSPPASQPGPGFVFLKTEYRLEKVLVQDILYIEGMKDYLMVHTAQGKIMTLMNFKKLFALLPGDDFARVHKSYVVPLAKIDRIARNVIEIGGRHVPISDSYKEAFFGQLRAKGLL